MSADRAPTFIDDRRGPDADAWHDPHDIIPEAFKQRYADCASARAALRKAEQAPTTTDTDALPRCPECESIKIHTKTAVVEQSNQRSEPYCCSECTAHFATPKTPVNDEHGQQTTLDRRGWE